MTSEITKAILEHGGPLAIPCALLLAGLGVCSTVIVALWKRLLCARELYLREKESRRIDELRHSRELGEIRTRHELAQKELSHRLLSSMLDGLRKRDG